VSLPRLSPSEGGDGVADDDSALLAGMARADQGALAALYDRYAPRMLAAAVRMLGSSREAQDLVHDVFIEAWEHARQYDSARGTVRAWLFVRLRSRALDRLGRDGRPREHGVAESMVTAVARQERTPDADEFFALKQAFDRLSPDVRRALDSTYFEGLTAKEIAERDAVPEGTIRSRLARGLAELSALFTSKGRGGDGG
jgi:RNA polymerase sigma-70 factor (ECF subfamily)